MVTDSSPIPARPGIAKPSLPFRLWHRLTEPAAAIQAPDIRRRARLLSALLLLLIVFGVAGVVITPWQQRPVAELATSWLTIAVLVPVYGLSRTARYFLSAALALTVILVGVVANAFLSREIVVLNFLILGVLVSSLLLAWEMTVVVSVAGIATILWFWALSPAVSPFNAIVPLLNVAGVAALAIVAAVMQRQDLARIERQARELSLSEARLTNVLRTASEAVIAFDERQNVLLFNEAAEQIFGYRAAEVLGQPLDLLLPARFQSVHRRHVERFATGAEQARRLGERRELVGRRSDGSEFPMEAGISKLTSRDQTVFTFIASDITARKRSQEALERREQRFRALIENSTDIIALVDGAGTITYTGPSTERLMGYANQDFVGHSVFEFIHPGDLPNAQDRFVELLQRPRAVVIVEVRVRHSSGTWRWLEAVGTNLLAEPVVEALVVNLRDITERKQAEEAQLRLAAIVQTTDDAIISTNPDRVISSWNHGAEKLYGYAEREAIGQPLDVLVPPQLAEQSLQTRERVMEGERFESFETQRVRKDGTVVTVSMTMSPVIDASGEILGVSSIARDVGERKRAEEARRRRADEFAALYDTARDLSAPRDLQTLLQAIVERAVTLLEAPAGTLYLYDAAQRELELAFSYGYPRLAGARLAIGESMAGQVAHTLAPVLIERYDHWEHRTEKFMEIPFRAMLGVPMLYAGELIGVLGVAMLEPSTRQFDESDTRLLTLFASQAAGAVQQTRLLEETRARAEQLALLYEAGLTLNRVLDPTEQLALLCQTAMRAVHGDRAEFFRFDAATDELSLEYSLGYEPEMLAALRGLRFPAGGERGVVGSVCHDHMSLNIPDVRADARFVAVDPAIRSGLWTPVEHDEQPRGVLAALSTRAHAFSAQDEHLLALFANQISVAMENARLFAETRQRLTELEAVSRLSAALRTVQTLDEMLSVFLDHALALINTSTGSIWLYERSSETLQQRITRGWFTPQVRPRMPGEGITGQAYATGAPMLSREFKTDARVHESTRSLDPEGWGGAVIPIHAADQIIGVLSVAVQLPRELNMADAHLLSTLAEIAGNAIHRSRLHQQTEQRLHTVQALHGIDTAIAASFDLHLTLNIALDLAIAELGVDATDLLLLRSPDHALEYVAGRGFRALAVQGTRLRIGQGPAGRAAVERRSVSVADLGQDQDFVRAHRLDGEGFVGYYAVPLIAKGEIKGVYEVFQRGALSVDAEWREFLEALASQAAIAVDNATLFDHLQRSNLELMLAYDSTIEGWSRALDLRDKETEGHTRRVTEMTLQLARVMGLSESEMVHVRRGALLHDIGKMGVPDSILLKPGSLNDEEWVVMRKHPIYAYDMLSPIPFLRPALDIPYYHHEKWDGTGYPQGLKGEQIPLAARIFAVVDVWDALSSNRPYRAGWPPEKVREYLIANSGTHFDPDALSAFLALAQEA